MTRQRAIAIGIAIALALILLPAGLQVKKAAAADPTFCTNCHQMDIAYEAWQEGSHRDITCVTCHPGSLATDLRHGWLAMLGQPDVRSETEVDEAVCKGCHVDGASERWPKVAATAGHRVHQGQDIPCISCHGTSLHIAQPSVDGCADCHAETIDLTRMAGVHCLDCHAFLADTPDLDVDADTCRGCHQENGRAPAPAAHGELDCLTCHAPHEQAAGRVPACEECHTQQLARHGGGDTSCGDCHLPHKRAAQAAERCTDCHTRPSHGGHLACADCHVAHQPGAATPDCASCHADRLGLHALRSHTNCVDCHRPHSLTPPTAPQCLGCHSEVTKEHASVGCTGCHHFDR